MSSASAGRLRRRRCSERAIRASAGYDADGRKAAEADTLRFRLIPLPGCLFCSEPRRDQADASSHLPVEPLAGGRLPRRLWYQAYYFWKHAKGRKDEASYYDTYGAHGCWSCTRGSPRV